MRKSVGRQANKFLREFHAAGVPDFISNREAVMLAQHVGVDAKKFARSRSDMPNKLIDFCVYLARRV